ncbi:MAG: polyprenyl synthetase family protein [Candidatus Nanoarchaeia archaeon]|nr:polyprenyl synthetase family protein [Candidatus Nanoarchaeia archaeon]
MVTLYFDRMRETSNEVAPVVDLYLNNFRNSKGNFYDLISQIPKSFMRQGSNIRTYLLRTAYESLTDKNWKWIAPVGASIEFLLASMYYSNWIHDEKGGIRSKGEDKDILTAAIIMRELSQEVLVDGLKDKIPLEKLINLFSLFNETNKIFQEGQFVDIKVNNYKNWNNLVSEEDQMNLFLERTYKINAAFIERIAKVGGLLAEGSEQQLNALGKFGEYFGMAHQIMNDVADFVPPRFGISTTTKLPEDSYADVKDGHLTLPIIYTLYHDINEDRVKKIVNVLEGGKQNSLNDLEEATSLLIENGAIKYTINYARHFKKMAKETIKKFPKDKRMPLDWLLISIDSNKYYTSLRNLEAN